MEIQRKETEDKGKFFIEDNDRQIALMTYKKTGDGVITIDHTEVDSNFRGKGLGVDLVKAGVNYARENRLKIIPTCVFAKKLIALKTEFQDVLAEQT